jgi:hypothetical protein
VFTLSVIASAFFSGIILGRLAYLMFRDLRMGFPWLFGIVDDSPADQVRLLTFSAAATIASSVFALNAGVDYIWPVVITPFLFNWAAEVILTLHRAFGAVIENFVLNFHPVDISYDLFKRSMVLVWTRALSRSRKNDVTEDAGAEATHHAEDSAS